MKKPNETDSNGISKNYSFEKNKNLLGMVGAFTFSFICGIAFKKSFNKKYKRVS